MTQSTIREQLERWVVEEPAGNGLVRKVPLWDYVDRAMVEAVAAERERIVAAVEAMPSDAVCHRWHEHTDESPLPVYGVTRAAVLAIVKEPQPDHPDLTYCIDGQLLRIAGEPQP